MFSLCVIVPLYFQKKAHLAVVQQELTKAREEALNQEKLKEEEEMKIIKTLEESEKVCCETNSKLFFIQWEYSIRIIRLLYQFLYILSTLCKEEKMFYIFCTNLNGFLLLTPHWKTH